MHKIKNNPISNDDLVNKEYVDNSILTKQDKTDNTLDTTDKTVVGAINEINGNALGLTSHTRDTNIHVTTSDKTKWNKVDNKANATDLTTHTSDTDIHITSAERTKWDKVDNKIDKTDITTIINSSSTDTQVPSAKAIYNKSKNSITNLPNVTDIKSYAETFGNLFITDTVRLRDSTSSPYGVDNNINDFYYTIYNMDEIRYKRIIAYDIRKNDMYMIMRNADGWGKWRRVCTTTVADVPTTKININASYMSNANCYYEVKNGICYVNFLSGTYVVPSQLDGVTLATGLPKPSAPEVAHTYILWAGLPSQQVILFVKNDGRLVLHASVNSNGGCIYTTFSYPVKE